MPRAPESVAIEPDWASLQNMSVTPIHSMIHTIWYLQFKKCVNNCIQYIGLGEGPKHVTDTDTLNLYDFVAKHNLLFILEQRKY